MVQAKPRSVYSVTSVGLAEEDCTYDITPHTPAQSRHIERAFAHKQNLPISSATIK